MNEDSKSAGSSDATYRVGLIIAILVALVGIATLTVHLGIRWYALSMDEREAKNDLCAMGAVFTGDHWDLSVDGVAAGVTLRRNGGMPAISRSVNDEGLADLLRLSRVDSLDLHGQPITDAGLLHVMRLRKLRRLNIKETQVTAKGAADLQQALPNCDIVR